jgi:hypothetical protein
MLAGSFWVGSCAMSDPFLAGLAEYYLIGLVPVQAQFFVGLFHPFCDTAKFCWERL